MITTNGLRAGMIHGGAVVHLSRDGEHTLCGRYVMRPGESDARLCKSCAKISGTTEINAPMGDAQSLVASCTLEHNHVDTDKLTSTKWEAFQLSMFRDVIADYQNGAENSACWVGTLMLILDTPKLRVDSARASITITKGGKGDYSISSKGKLARSPFAGSDKQRELILSLVRQVDELNAELYPNVKPLSEGYTEDYLNGLNTQAKVRKDIDGLFEILNVLKKKRDAQPKTEPKESGWRKGSVYVINGVFHRVHISQSSGRPYTQAWIGESWEYQGMRELKNCTPENKITAEQAAQWGHEHEWCVFCSRTLDDQRSRNAGYGSTCADNYGLPWG